MAKVTIANPNPKIRSVAWDAVPSGAKVMSSGGGRAFYVAGNDLFITIDVPDVKVSFDTPVQPIAVAAAKAKEEATLSPEQKSLRLTHERQDVIEQRQAQRTRGPSRQQAEILLRLAQLAREIEKRQQVGAKLGVKAPQPQNRRVAVLNQSPKPSAHAKPTDSPQSRYVSLRATYGRVVAQPGRPSAADLAARAGLQKAASSVPRHSA